MTPLGEKLKARIEAEGPLMVAEWMTACLQDPVHGYYMSRDPFGRDGDFTTAPEISQMFGELLGLWAAVQWQQMGEPEAVNLVELGPGRGTLMADALRAAKGAPAFLNAVHLHLIEISPVLKSVQSATLGDFDTPVDWHGSFDDVPRGPVIAIANEFLDALPVEQFVMTNEGWRERLISWDDGLFIFVPGDIDMGDRVPSAFRDAQPETVYETSPAVDHVVREIAQRVSDDGGSALFIDYGYGDDGPGDTWQALRAHAFADPLSDPGEQDLTAHVNFPAVNDSIATAGARAWGPIDQGLLLERLGLGARATALLSYANKEQAIDIAEARRRLSAPDAMGRLFKAVAVTRKDAAAPPGFQEVAWAS